VPEIEVREAERPERHDPPSSTRVLGVDPGFRAVGLVVLDFATDGLRLIHRERVTTSTADGDPGTRLDRIGLRIHSVFSAHLPDLVGIEDVTNVGHAKGETSSAATNQIEVPGIVRGLALCYGSPPVYRVPTNSGRMALFGRGKSRGKDKGDVLARASELLGARRLNHEEADAVATAFGAFAAYVRARRRKR